ncbi:MAG: hypothetical protein J0I34_32910 [Pseudonocardia sp.]|uniref:hypothetical protein n=2 Tax=unclassified Pseudonocardia TaxID=2619320 RepID=UPI00086AA35A|nr:hypothetical protein [Pseudonocardia sp.]MBN9113568.1 hypothetical protein [Pseudonocardia sp.]ODU29616.1 MAG: hypothetical protein ABS80_01540 [Pseudonocardia sp. SCN 72-51]
MSGEEAHAKGAEGAQRARTYLELTSRAKVQWINPHPLAVRKLTFTWADDSEPFSFDIGGQLLGEELDGQEFLAECKNYATSSDLLPHYRKFLAQCYRAYSLRPERCDNFLFISFAAFGGSVWDTLTSVERVIEAVESRKVAATTSGEVDVEIRKAVADRLRILILSPWHERLVLTKEHLGVIRRFDAEKEV